MFRRSTSLILGPDLVYHRWLGRQRSGRKNSAISRRTEIENRQHQRAIVYGARPETCPVLALEAWMQRAGIGVRVAVSSAETRRQGRRQPHRADGGADRPVPRTAIGLRPKGLRGAFATGGVRHQCGRAGSVGREDHGSHRASELGDGEGLHPANGRLPGSSGGGVAVSRLPPTHGQPHQTEAY